MRDLVPATLSTTLPRVIVSVILSGLAFGIAFSYRTDYVGHYLGGYGETLLLLSIVPLLPHSWRDLTVVTAVVVAIALGFGTESTIFRLAIFDPVDFYNQSLGAVVAGCCFLGDRSRPAVAGGSFGLAFLVLFVGFYFAFA